MGSRAFLGATSGTMPPKLCSFLTSRRGSPYPPQLRNLSARSSLQPPDVPRLAEAARISLKQEEIEDFAPKIGQVIDWFGQLQAVNLDGIEPTLRADTEVGDNLRPDSPVTFENREAILAAVPNYQDPYIKVPKILNKE